MQQLTLSPVGGHLGRLARLAALLALLVAVLVAPQAAAAAGWDVRDLTVLAGAPAHYGQQPYVSPAGYTAVTFFDDYGNIYEESGRTPGSRPSST